VDVRAVLRAARAEAGLDQRRLALAAGVARTTVVAYETGAQSPTVRQLDRLLAACGLRASVVLEPVTADLDERLDSALVAGRPYGLSNLPTIAASLAAAHVHWAVDGVSAVALHGLPLPHEELALVVVDDDTTRGWLRRHWAKGWDRHGFSLAPSWYESAEQVRGYVRRPISTTLGSLHVRFVDAPPEPVLQVQVDGDVVPVLALAEVRHAHPSLTELLDRHEHRLAGGAGRRTV
jgi:transcriptional regulator with XRE-family HTH domain